MKVDFIVERETEKAFEICTHVGYVQSGDILPEHYGTQKYKHITEIADWWCCKNLK